MNNTTIQTPEQTIYSIEDITRMKKAKIDEIRQCKKRMTDITTSIFSPAPSTGKVDGLINHISTGIAIYDGIMTGIKLMRKARRAFSGHRKW